MAGRTPGCAPIRTRRTFSPRHFIAGVRSKIPAETQSGKVFRLRGKGIKGVRSIGYGDLLCHVVVETPVSLTDRQKELLQEFDDISRSNSARHNPKAQGWLDRVKEFFGG